MWERGKAALKCIELLLKTASDRRLSPPIAAGQVKADTV
jgi:hypothetical protein